MARIEEVLGNINEDKNFIGTIALHDEEISLPDGSSIALGIDGGHWVLVYQKQKGAAFVVYEYNHHNNSLHIDKKPGTQFDYQEMRKLIEYFFSHAHTEDLVTILPPGGDHV